MTDTFKYRIANCTEAHFDDLALEIFQFQASNCKVYSDYLASLKVEAKSIKKIQDIPFLPIQFFKYHKVVSNNFEARHIFKSSGTTSDQTSQHFLSDENWYKDLSLKTFQKFYGPVTNYHILGLLPSYLENSASSLLFMLDHFMKETGSIFSKFYDDNYQLFYTILNEVSAINDGKKILIWGVGYALLDFLEVGFDLTSFTEKILVLETGGMKGRRTEMIKSEFHLRLCNGFGVDKIHSEYGMTELLSQAYSVGEGVFSCSSTMKVLLRDVNDPFEVLDENSSKKTGGINVIDLANIDTCSFIETQDLGRYQPQNQFEIIGRFDHADIRGCNLLMEKNDWQK